MNDDLPQPNASAESAPTDLPTNSVSSSLPIHDNNTEVSAPAAAPTASYSAEPPLMVTAEEVAGNATPEVSSYHQAQPVPITTVASAEPTLPAAEISTSPELPSAASAPVNTEVPVEPTAEPKSEPMAEADHDSILGVMGEVLGSAGITIFVLFLLAPLYKSVIGASVWGALGTIALLTCTVLMGLGFVLSLFLRGRVLFKVLLIVFALISALLYIGLFGSAAASDSINALLGPLLDLYR